MSNKVISLFSTRIVRVGCIQNPLRSRGEIFPIGMSIRYLTFCHFIRDVTRKIDIMLNSCYLLYAYFLAAGELCLCLCIELTTLCLCIIDCLTKRGLEFLLIWFEIWVMTGNNRLIEWLQGIWTTSLKKLSKCEWSINLIPGRIDKLYLCEKI